jgi:subtilase family serine protease
MEHLMSQKGTSSRWTWASLASLACALFSSPVLNAQIERPRVADISSDHGPVQPFQQITLTVHLNMHNQAAFDKAVNDLYTPGSPTYHQWMTNSEIARYAPTPAEVDAVRRELQSHGLSVLSVSSDDLSIRARGPAASVESAFQTQIHEFERQGKVFHANVTPAKLAGPAGSLVHGVTGLTSIHMRPFLKSQVDPRTGKARTTVQTPATTLSTSKSSAAGGFHGIATNNCFGGLTTVNLTTSGAALPVGVYSGNVYDDSALICSWTPTQIQNHYGLTSAYKKGIDGTGQTIVIVDGPTDGAVLTSDLALFSSLTGLPAPTSSNFSVIYPDGKPTALSLQVDNWQTEAAIDSQWAHSIAPKAKIIVEIMPTSDWTELEYGIDYARQKKLGNVISNSYGYPEALFGNQTVRGFEQVLKKAAAAGVAVNFATGDSGDLGLGAPNAGGQSYPATSTYVTAVGGTSLGIPNGQTNGAEAGWGNNAVYLSFATNFVLDPPLKLGNIGGAGGGESTFFAKPSWEKSLPGAGRVLPDIAALADPYTGAVLVVDGIPQAGWGGTSLACPIFSAIWALADQKAGTSLGQAAPLLANLSSSAITDVIPVSSPTNVAGIIFDAAGSTYYSSDSLLPPLYTTQFYSALWNLGGGEYVDISFGTDTSLTVTPGWDNVTGWGVPKGLGFIDAAAKAK